MTIISRCQKFQFTKIDDDNMVDNLKRIAVAENIDVDDSILYEISRLSDGCCRDAVNLFDQLNSYANGPISIEQLYEISGSVSFNELAKVLNFIADNDSIGVMSFCNKINAEGKSIFKFVEELMLFIKDIISYKVGIDNVKINEKKAIISDLSNDFSDSVLYEMIEVLNELLNKIKFSSYPAILLSVTLLKFIDSHKLDVDDKKEKLYVEKDSSDVSSNSLLKSDSVDNDNDDRNDCVNGSKLNEEEVGLSDLEISIRINNALASASKNKLNYLKSKWVDIDNYLIDSEFSFLMGILKDCNPVVAGDEYLIVTANYGSLVSRFNELYKKIETFLNSVLGNYIYVVAISNESWAVEKKKYIDNLKNGIKYEMKPLVEVGITGEIKLENNKQNDVDMLKDLVGNDIIKYV
jgi:DNA polymerase-3 subunit gamma/tau